MILEIASLQVRPGQAAAFEAAFLQAQAIIASMPGYLGHELQRCLERDDHYMLLVRWRSVQDHEVGFRSSPQYQQWRALLHHFYDPFPTVLHYEAAAGPGLAPAPAGR
ncbi:antibiotic biosynthesis monooxygenase [Roseateles sp.]|uniref:antibiotic biosynthesis monooxygenase family protein n=1 Tax=Roseateles sp. TaxID=1971397 RepID=UPI002E09DE96|nr:antibiotic biosynthesis monooxygenase [Roseateles sp.]